MVAAAALLSSLIVAVVLVVMAHPAAAVGIPARAMTAAAATSPLRRLAAAARTLTRSTATLRPRLPQQPDHCVATVLLSPSSSIRRVDCRTGRVHRLRANLLADSGPEPMHLVCGSMGAGANTFAFGTFSGVVGAVALASSESRTAAPGQQRGMYTTHQRSRQPEVPIAVTAVCMGRRHVYSGDAAGIVRIWDFEQERSHPAQSPMMPPATELMPRADWQPQEQHTVAITWVDAVPGVLVASCDANGQLLVRSWRSGRPVFASVRAHWFPVCEALLRPDGTLGCRGNAGEIGLLRLRAFTGVGASSAVRPPVTDERLSMAAARHQQAVSVQCMTVWSSGCADRAARLDGAASAPPADAVIVSGATDGSVRIWCDGSGALPTSESAPQHPMNEVVCRALDCQLLVRYPDAGACIAVALDAFKVVVAYAGGNDLVRVYCRLSGALLRQLSFRCAARAPPAAQADWANGAPCMLHIARRMVLHMRGNAVRIWYYQPSHPRTRSPAETGSPLSAARHRKTHGSAEVRDLRRQVNEVMEDARREQHERQLRDARIASAFGPVRLPAARWPALRATS